jgi:hypothetical protein
MKLTVVEKPQLRKRKASAIPGLLDDSDNRLDLLPDLSSSLLEPNHGLGLY